MLIVGALLIGGLFLLNQNGGLQGLLGGGAAQTPAPAAEEEPKEGGEGEEGQDGMEGQEGMGEGGYGGMPGMPQGYPVPVPVPVPGYPRPPFGAPPFLGPPRAPLGIPFRCRHACRFGPSIPCKACLRGGFPGPGPYPAKAYPAQAALQHRWKHGKHYAYGQSRYASSGCGCGR